VTLFDRPLIVAFALAYLVVMVGVGVWASRRIRDARDFFIAGQRIGLVVTSLATMSAAFSGFVFLGGPGLTYRMGIVSLWIVLPVGFTSALLCHVVGRKLRLLANVRQVYTVPDAFRVRFGGRAAGGVSAIAVAVGSIGYLAAQLLALGVLLRAVLGLENLAVAMGVGLLVLVIYSSAGGMVAGVYTDVVQGALMLVAAVAVFVRAVTVSGGWEAMSRSIASSSLFGPTHLTMTGGLSWFTVFGFYLVFGVGVLGQPQMLHKFFMLDDLRKMRWMPFVLGGSQALCLLIWVGVGLAVPALVAQGRLAPLVRPDDAAPSFLLGFTPEAVAGLAFAGILAAIMSTSDSFLNIGAAALVRDLPRAFGRPLRNELFHARWVVVAVGLFAAGIAWAWGDLIALLGTLAFGTFAAALAPSLAVGLNWARVGSRAVVASVATGISLNLGLEFLVRQDRFADWVRPPWSPGVVSSAVALAGSFLVLIVVASIGEGDSIAPDLERIVDDPGSGGLANANGPE